MQFVSLEVRVSPKEDTVWLTLAQIAELFEKIPRNITMHISDIYTDGELDRNSTCKDFLQVQKEGGRNIERSIKHYNLDLIISVGYRVKSKRGIAFRKWAGQVLKEYLIKGAVLNGAKLDISKIHQRWQKNESSTKSATSFFAASTVKNLKKTGLSDLILHHVVVDEHIGRNALFINDLQH